MSSPITSVPEPSEAASTSSDPLAGVITQVSPRQAAAPIRGGPARPTKVAKQGTAKAANLEKKKKKKASLAGTADEALGKESTEKAPETGAIASEDATPGPSAEPSSAGEASTSHSQNPSSTLVGTTTTQPSTLTTSDAGDGIGKDKPTDATLTPTEPAPTNADLKSAGGASGQQDMAEAAQKLSKPVSKSNENSNAAEKIPLSEKKGTPPQSKPTPTSISKGKEKQKQRGIVARIVAILTCSSATQSMAAADAEDEKRLMAEKSTTKSQVTNGKATKGDVKKTARPKGLPASRKGSMERSAATGNSTGGGTILSKEETGDVMSGAVVPPGSSFVPHDTDHTGKRGAAAAGLIGSGVALGGIASHKHDESEDEDEDDEDEWMGEEMPEDEDQTEEQRLIQQGGAGIPKDENGNPRPLLAPIGTEDTGRKCLVLDLDETLVHSSFKMISNADFIVPVEIEGTVHNVYVIKRPGVDEFMRQMGEIYEVVVFTASLAKYADPVLDILDIHQVVRHRLFRESCYNHKGNYVKDLSQLGRDIHTSIIIDNSPASYIFHPNNAVPISSWFNDPHDTELTDLCPFLAELADVDDVRAVLDGLL